MKRFFYRVLVSLTLVALIIGCSVSFQDKPLPMSQDNMEKCVKALEKAAKSIAPTPSQDGTELMVGAYKTVIEKKMGFSFDKTIRSVMLFNPTGDAWQLMGPIIGYVISDPKRALDKGFISQRTFDILDTGAKVKAPLTKEGDEFLGFVAECQSKNNGTCDAKLLLSIISDHNALPDVSKVKNESDKLSRIEYQLEEKYDIFHMGVNEWITLPDGQHFNTNGLFTMGASTYKFVVNKNKIDIAKRYANMLAEEKVALSQ